MDTATSNGQEHVLHNIKAVTALYERAERQVTRHQRLVEVVTGTAARPRTLYFVAALALGWAAVNGVLHAFYGRAVDPPPFYWLQGVMGFTALLLAIVILAAQRRQATLAEERAHLDLQVNLLAEQKIAKVIGLLEELRRDLPAVRDRADPVAEAMAEPADPHAVVSALKESLDDE
jgi:uncharacterized membrane protein